ncbi:hypothetical protein [Candidatus Stoquefichus massiliensis]|uniref:hypothetical protein n=1 Tax=Candidatus Stoquefichus massiliensis TaxID=1470350 RepID=UPI0004867485|nr:hypothetical protein [Candidatus Stoquefichus massiliensis]
MNYKTRREALDFILKHELDTYPPLDFDSMSDEEIFEHADEVYELLEIMRKKSKLKDLSKS